MRFKFSVFKRKYKRFGGPNYRLGGLFFFWKSIKSFGWVEDIKKFG